MALATTARSGKARPISGPMTEGSWNPSLASDEGGQDVGRDRRLVLVELPLPPDLGRVQSRRPVGWAGVVGLDLVAQVIPPRAAGAPVDAQLLMKEVGEEDGHGGLLVAVVAIALAEAMTEVTKDDSVTSVMQLPLRGLQDHRIHLIRGTRGAAIPRVVRLDLADEPALDQYVQCSLDLSRPAEARLVRPKDGAGVQLLQAPCA